VTAEELLALEGIGWEGDLGEVRRDRSVRDRDPGGGVSAVARGSGEIPRS